MAGWFYTDPAMLAGFFQIGNLFFEFWEIFLDRIPQKFEFYSKIFMCENVSHAHDFIPGNLGVLIFEFRRDIFRRLTYYFEAPYC